MAEPTLRQLTMLQLVPRAPTSIDVSLLRERLGDRGFDVHVRTVQRDLQALSAMFPLVSDESTKPFRWSWSRDAAAFDLPLMSVDAAIALTLADKFLAPLIPASTRTFLQPHVVRGANILDEASTGHKNWRRKVRAIPSGFPRRPPDVDPAVHTAITEALLSDHQLRISYSNVETGEHFDFPEVHPLGLIARDPVIYLICHFWDYGVKRGHIRQLAMHRVIEATVVDKHIKKIKGFDIDTYIAEGEMGFKIGPTIKLVADFEYSAGRHLFETPLSQDQKLQKLNNETLRLRATVPDTKELRWWLMAFGSSVIVSRPKRLAEEIQEEAETMMKAYTRVIS